MFGKRWTERERGVSHEPMTVLRKALVAAVGAYLASASFLCAGEVLFSDEFLTSDKAPLSYGGWKNYDDKEPLQHIEGPGGDYVFSSIGLLPGFDGFLEIGSREGKGLTIKCAELQTVDGWTLAAVPKGKVLRLEVDDVFFESDATTKESAGYQGFGLSTDRAVVNHSSKEHNGFFWTFYGCELGENMIRPYVQLPEKRLSTETAEVRVALSSDPQKPDSFVIEVDPEAECVRFFQNSVEVFNYFFTPEDLESIKNAKLKIAYYDLDQGLGRIGAIGSWSLSISDPQSK